MITRPARNNNETRRYLCALSGIALCIAIAALIRLSEPWPRQPRVGPPPSQRAATRAARRDVPLSATPVDAIVAGEATPADVPRRHNGSHTAAIRQTRSPLPSQRLIGARAPEMSEPSRTFLQTTPAAATPPLAASVLMDVNGPAPLLQRRVERDPEPRDRGPSIAGALSGAGVQMAAAFRLVGRSFKRAF